MRQVVLDTETTGLEWQKGNRVVEMAAWSWSSVAPPGGLSTPT